MSGYEKRTLPFDAITTENHGTLGLEIEVDSLGMATIRFGNSFTLRINEFNVDELRNIFHDVSRELALERRDRSAAI